MFTNLVKHTGQAEIANRILQIFHIYLFIERTEQTLSHKSLTNLFNEHKRSMIDVHTNPFSQNTITIISVDKGGRQNFEFLYQINHK